MPTSSNIAKFPQGMLDVLEAVCETEKPAVIPYETFKIASAERLKFYGLVRALRINQHSLADKAVRLTFLLSNDGPKKGRGNILTIKFPDSTAADAFYSAVAMRIQGDNNGE
jgi:hypothetical protein